MENFSFTARIAAGEGAMSVLAEFGAERLFLVADPCCVGTGAVQRAAELSGAKSVEIFDRVLPNPTVSLAAEGAARILAFGPDLIAALGGGSTVDCAKAMVYFARTGAAFAAIPITSGSGAEVTDFTMLTGGGIRYPLSDPGLRPQLVILDGKLLRGMPKPLIAETGFEVLTHAVEACTAAGAGILSDLLAREAFRMAFGALPASYAGCEAVRLRIHLASTMAGMACAQAGLGLCHAVSCSLEDRFRVPLGRLNAVLLPAVMECNAHAAGHRYAELARWAGMSGSADGPALRNLKNGLLRLRRELELPQTLAQAGIPLQELQENMNSITQTALEDPAAASNPVKADAFLIRRILEGAAGSMTDDRREQKNRRLRFADGTGDAALQGC